MFPEGAGNFVSVIHVFPEGAGNLLRIFMYILKGAGNFVQVIFQQNHLHKITYTVIFLR